MRNGDLDGSLRDPLRVVPTGLALAIQMYLQRALQVGFRFVDLWTKMSTNKWQVSYTVNNEIGFKTKLDLNIGICLLSLFTS